MLIGYVCVERKCHFVPTSQPRRKSPVVEKVLMIASSFPLVAEHKEASSFNLLCVSFREYKNIEAVHQDRTHRGLAIELKSLNDDILIPGFGYVLLSPLRREISLLREQNFNSEAFPDFVLHRGRSLTLKTSLTMCNFHFMLQKYNLFFATNG